MDELTPSDSISQSGSREDNAFYGAAPYPPPMPMYPQHYQQPSPYTQGQQYYPSYGAQVHAQGYPTYLPTPQPVASPTYPHSASRSHHHKGRSRSRRNSSFASSSTPPGGLGSLYVPTLSLSGSGSSTLVPVAANAPYSAPYGSGTGSYALGAPYGVQQPQMLHVSQTTYTYANPSAASPYGTHSATTSPNTSPYAMETRALSSHSHHSAHSPRSSHSHHSSVAHSPRSSHSHRSSRSHSYQLPPVSPTPSNQPLVVRPNHDESVVVPLASGGCVVFPAQGHSMYINPSHQYPQETERRKPSFFGGLTGFVGRKSKRSRRDSY